MFGTLYMCATPIGNMEDITLRVLRILREVDAIWAEDTRHTLRLLAHYDIRKPLVSCHEHNERERAEELVSLLRAGRSIAYCSDAGMPGISDPGVSLVGAAIAAGLPITVLPGASAAITAAILSGLPCDTFTFFGFLPRDRKKRQDVMDQLRACEHLMLLYESPVRLPATLRELQEVLGEGRQAAVLRELTKVHEEGVRGTLAQLAARFCDPPKGECVIAIAGSKKEPANVLDADLNAVLLKLLEEGFSSRDAASTAAIVLGIPKKRAYQRVLYLQNEEN